MFSAEDCALLIDLARVFAVDQEKQRGGRAANNKRKSLHIKLLTLWCTALEPFCRTVFDREPGSVAFVSNKYSQIRDRLEHLTLPGVTVYKETPLLGHRPGQEEGEDSGSESDDSCLGAPVDFRDLVELSQLSASPSASARDRSRSPVPHISDASSSGYTVDRASGFLPSGRPCPSRSLDSFFLLVCEAIFCSTAVSFASAASSIHAAVDSAVGEIEGASEVESWAGDSACVAAAKAAAGSCTHCWFASCVQQSI